MTPSPIIIERPDEAAAAQHHPAIVEKARALVIADQGDHRIAQEFLKQIATAEKAVTDLFADPKKKAHEAHKSICTQESKLLGPLREARSAVSVKIAEYEEAARRAAEEEQRKREAEARKAEEDRLLNDAMAAEASGDKETAEAILAEPVAAPVVQVAPAIAKVDGVSSRKTWSAQVTDAWALIQHVAKNKDLAYLLTPNTVALNNMARALREAMNVPGVRAVGTTSSSVRTA